MTSENKIQSPNLIRLLFTKAMSSLYQREVPLYRELLALVENSNDAALSNTTLSKDEVDLLSLEHHGAIRLGTAYELSTMRRLFAVMGMHPVDYYDLSASDIPVHSTAFRALHSSDLKQSPFRIFCSLLRLDLLDDSLKNEVDNILSKRKIFSEELLSTIEEAEKQGGLFAHQIDAFVQQATDVFRWHQHATIDKTDYDKLKSAHGLIADVVSFKGPHINHLTPRVLDIDDCQQQFSRLNIEAKKLIEGPPRRSCPILLRQTSFLAVEETIEFTNGEIGTHTARFGEIEQRGIALTLKGRELYDSLLSKATNADKNMPYSQRLKDAFADFPDTYTELYEQELAFFKIKASDKKERSNNLTATIDSLIDDGYLILEPIQYEDFLPISAAGIFTSNLRQKSENKTSLNDESTSISQINVFEEQLGTKVISSFDLYEAEQKETLKNTMT